ncbi:Asp-tRNA(Asn)/Glu-tRNA(Gln) amidotransferase subunit GatC [Candidatus Peregrinibacteria bacterium]|nr:MAG: Asp-tRNA(Asn)/Glu-tRNA(Gln) amidotransferase subunit GatC [Candidatus Peregrinibacteria bacterium]
MKLTKEQVQHIAKLARLHLTDEEMERYAGQLTDILTYVEVLKELDTSSVKETSQVTGLSLEARADQFGASLCTADELLECSPLPKEAHQIRVKRVI